jgi:hypothetical protein
MSKPQIIVQDTAGLNNKDINATRSRLIKGGSWKNQRTIVIVPSADMIAAKVYLSHCSLMFPPNNGVVRLLALGQEVGDAYSNCIESILNDPNLSQFEYIFCLESDNIVPSDAVIKLIEQMELHPELSAIGGLYYTKGPGSPAVGPDGKIIAGEQGITGGGCPQIWGDVNDPILNFRPQLPDPTGGLVECCGTGMGATLFRLSMFKDTRLKRPWFKTLPNATQDLAFFMDARKYGYRCGIACNVLCGHYDLEGKFGIPDFTW